MISLGGSQKMSTAQRLDFYDFILTLLGEGRLMLDACEEISGIMREHAEEQMVDWNGLNKKADLYQGVADDIRKGDPFSSVMQSRIPESEVMMIFAGEKGSLVEGIRAARSEAANEATMKATITQAAIYPLVILLVISGALHWMGHNLLPTFEDIVPSDQWSDGEQRIYWLTQNVTTWLPLLALSTGVFGWLSLMVHRYIQGNAREKVHLFPPFNVIRAITGASFLSTLANLVKSGDPFQEGLERMRETSNSNYMLHYVDEVLDNIREKGSSGGAGQSLKINLFDQDTIIALEIFGKGGDTGDFSAQMERIADKARDQAIRTVGNLSKLMNYTMLIAAGIVIIMAVSTMYGIVGQVSDGL